MDLEVKENLLFVARGCNGIYIFDISGMPQSLPRAKAVYDLPDAIRDFVLIKQDSHAYLYIANEDAGMHLLEIE